MPENVVQMPVPTPKPTRIRKRKAKVLHLPVETCLNIPVERVIKGARSAKLETVLVLGLDGEGGLYVASSFSDPADAMWLMELAKLNLLESCRG